MDGSTPETCAQCGFDSRRWSLPDAADLFEELGWWWAHATADFDADALNRRPGPAVWSILEYGLHTALAVAAIRTEIEAILAEDGCAPELDFDIGDATEDNWAEIDVTSTVADIEREGRASARLARRRDVPWGNVGVYGPHRVQAEAYLIHDAHDASHHMMDASCGLAALSKQPPSEGRVLEMTVWDGSGAKRSVEGGAIPAGGLQEDRPHRAEHRGRPFQAVCLWSAGGIETRPSADDPTDAELAASTNLVLGGVEWERLRPGALVRFDEVLVELSFPVRPWPSAVPAPWYGWVRTPGPVYTGQRVIVQA